MQAVWFSHEREQLPASPPQVPALNAQLVPELQEQVAPEQVGGGTDEELPQATRATTRQRNRVRILHRIPPRRPREMTSLTRIRPRYPRESRAQPVGRCGAGVHRAPNGSNELTARTGLGSASPSRRRSPQRWASCTSGTPRAGTLGCPRFRRARLGRLGLLELLANFVHVDLPHHADELVELGGRHHPRKSTE